MASVKSPAAKVSDVDEILRQWEEVYKGPMYNPTSTLERLAEIIEFERENYLKNNPDPTDTRHPCLTHPDCEFGYILNAVFQKEDFMTQLIIEYTCEVYSARNCTAGGDIYEINVAACRLLLDLLPVLETATVFIRPFDDCQFELDLDSLIETFFFWAKESIELFQSYAIIILAFIMKIPKRVRKFREQNGQMVLLMLARLRELQENPEKSDPLKILHPFSTFVESRRVVDSSQKSVVIEPPAPIMQQKLILRYLTTVGRSKYYIEHAFEENALAIIMEHVNISKNGDESLGFEALKYLGSLLSNDQYAVDFLRVCGLRKLLNIRSPSNAGDNLDFQKVSQRNPSHWKTIAEGIGSLPRGIIYELVSFALFFFTKKHEICKRHALMFLGHSFSSKVLLEQFETQNGMEKLFQTISTLKNDEKYPSIKFIAYITGTLLRYLKAHLYFGTDHMQQPKISEEGRELLQDTSPPRKIRKVVDKNIQDEVGTSQNHVNVGSIQQCVEKIHSLGGITFLLQVLSMARPYDVNYENHTLTTEKSIENCLEIIAICASVPKIVSLLCGRVNENIESSIMAMEVLLNAARGGITRESPAQIKALRVIVICVCADFHDNEGLIERVWKSVRTNRGLMTLLEIMMIECSAENDRENIYGDEMRALACQALCGLSRSQPVRQILKKLPLFAERKIHNLLVGPIDADSEQEYCKFKRYATELIERISQENLDSGMDNSAVEKNIVRDESTIPEKRNFYSHFCLRKSFELTDTDRGSFTYCTYSPCQKYLILGTRSGSLTVINEHSGVEEINQPYHDSFINHIECNETTNLLVSSSSSRTESAIRKCASVLWRIEASDDDKLSFRNVQTHKQDCHLEFSKKQNKMIGTSDERAHIYDIETGMILEKFASLKSRLYRRNRATFSLNDDIVLHDGILWDVKTGKNIHHFDQFSDNSNGVFHLNGSEIIANGQIWDIRTFKLLKNVSHLNEMEVRFQPATNIIYTYYTDLLQTTHKTSFHSLDAFDYDTIASVNVGRNICSLACNKLGTQIAVVENDGFFYHAHESCVNIYDVGKTYDDDDDDE